MSLIMHIFSILLLLLLIPCCAFSSSQDLPDLALLAVEKSQAELITSTPHSWKINVNSGTPIENQSVIIEVLEGTSKNPSLKSSGNVDFSSLHAIVDDVISQEMTDEEKALSLWRFVMDNAYHGAWGTSTDGLEHLNVYGYGYCGTFVAALEPLWWAAGLRARHVNIGNHAATEVFYDNDWHYIDAHRRCFFLEKDNKTIASLEDLNYIPELWDMKRQKPSLRKGEKKYYYMSMHPQDHGKSPIYSKQFSMSTGDLMALTWKENGKWSLERGAEGGGKPAPEPAIYANGTYRFLRDLSNPVQSREGLVSSSNVDWDDFTAGF
ncbi:MAG: putative domain lipoprotein, partial [Deltaproteobacteria bacterium]|nr:putative domain lipoprotein [Deltaproteobacteria bacterium]